MATEGPPHPDVLWMSGPHKGRRHPRSHNLPTRRATGRATRSRGSPGGKRRGSQTVLSGRRSRRGRRGSSRSPRSICLKGTGRSRGVRGKSGSATSSGLRAGSKLEGRDSVCNNGSRGAKLTDFGCTGRGRFPSAASFLRKTREKRVRGGEEIRARWLDR